MTVGARQRDTETRLFERLRTRYEGEGFQFTPHPGQAQLPDFLGAYRPDALAQKPGRNVAIEVKQRQGQANSRSLREIRRLFDGKSEWDFHVFVMGDDPLQTVTIAAFGAQTIRESVNDVRALARQGKLRPAFILAWSVLEAAFRAWDGGADHAPRTSGTIVQALAMYGRIDPETERQMRALVDLRERIVHGDLVAEPTAAEIEVVLSGVEQTMRADAA